MLNPQEQSRLDQLSQKFGQVAGQAGLSQAEAARLQQLQQKFEPQRVQSSPIQAAVQGFGQAATLGYLPQLQAGAEKAINFIAGDNVDEQLRAQGFDIESPTYAQSRDEFLAREARLQETNPGAMLAGQTVGGLAAGLGAGAVGGAAKVATMGQRLATGAKTGATLGLLRNPGEDEGEVSPLQITDRLKNASMDAVTGLVAQGGMEGVKKFADAIKSSPGVIKTFSQAKAFKASGAMLRDFRKAYGKGKVGELGQTMIDEGIVSLGDDVADIAKKSEIIRAKVGNDIGQIYQGVDESLNKIDPKKISPTLAKELSDTELDMGRFSAEFRAYIRNKLQGKVGARAVLSRMDAELDDLAQNGVIPLQRLKEIRQSVDEQIDFAKSARDLPGAEQAFLDMRNKLNDIAKNRIAVVDKIQGTKYLPDLTKANKTYSNLAEISKVAKDKMAREESNAAFGLRERISTGVGATVGGMIGGVPGAFAGGTLGAITTKAARQYGTPFVAIASNRAARALESNQALLGKFADPLLRASTSPKEFVTAVNLLMKDPEFKKKIDKVNVNKLGDK